MNVNLWFAKNVDSNEIISVVNSNKENEYKCPICNSDVIPKAIESKRITPHFAHIDKSKCSSESFIHFWMKHQFIEVGESFTIEADKRIEYVCKSFKTEVRYELDSGVYIPDIVVETECGNEIVFEMANTNKKQVKDYIDKWIELDRIVVEVDIKGMISESREFKALYYKGKCFNFNKRDGGYYNTIGKLKEDMINSSEFTSDYIKKLDWFWDEVSRFNDRKVGIAYMHGIIEQIKNDKSHKFYILDNILKKSKCTSLYKEYKKYLELDNHVVFSSMSVYEEIDKLYSIVNDKVKKIDSRFDIQLRYNRLPVYKSYYHGSRKHRYKYREVDCNYSVDISFRYNRASRIKIPVTNRFMSFTLKEKFLLEKIISAIPKNRSCIKCNKRFKLSEDEIKFYIDKEFSLPKRCKECRKKKRGE